MVRMVIIQIGGFSRSLMSHFHYCKPLSRGRVVVTMKILNKRTVTCPCPCTTYVHTYVVTRYRLQVLHLSNLTSSCRCYQALTDTYPTFLLKSFSLPFTPKKIFHYILYTIIFHLQRTKNQLVTVISYFQTLNNHN